MVPDEESQKNYQKLVNLWYLARKRKWIYRIFFSKYVIVKSNVWLNGNVDIKIVLDSIL